MTLRQRCSKAKSKLDIVPIDDTAFFEIYERDLKAQRRTSYSDVSIARELARQCSARGQIRIMAARIRDSSPETKNASVAAAIACLEDRQNCYYWMATRDVTIRDSAIQNGSTRLLIADAIAYALSRGKTFDFDGAAHDGISELYRAFRGKRVERIMISRTTRLEAFARGVRAKLRKLEGFPKAFLHTLRVQAPKLPSVPDDLHRGSYFSIGYRTGVRIANPLVAFVSKARAVEARSTGPVARNRDVNNPRLWLPGTMSKPQIRISKGRILGGNLSAWAARHVKFGVK